MSEHFDRLRDRVRARFKELTGYWVSRNSGYEIGICEALDIVLDKGRYWDAKWEDYLLEFKKGKSIWLDLVRYSEVILGVDENARRRTCCLFFVPDAERQRITEMICVDSTKIIQELRLTQDHARALVGLSSHVPRSLNAQASLTLRDVRNISEFVERQGGRRD